MSQNATTSYPPCHHCGKEGAAYVCSGCKDVDYCGKECQKEGWFDGGHKPICGKNNKEGRLMHDCILELFRLDLQFFETKLTNAQLRKFADALGLNDGRKRYKKRKDFVEFRFNHYLFAGPIALCLTGANACANVRFYDWPEFGVLYHQHVIQGSGWLEKYREQLQDFDFHIVNGPVFVKDYRDCNCGMDYCSADRLPVHGITTGALIVRNKTHAFAATVDRIFIQKDCQQVSYKDFENCLLFASDKVPVSDLDGFLHHNPPNAGIHVQYRLDNSPATIFQDDTVCCTTCLEFPESLLPSDAKRIGQHFWKCSESMKKLGFGLSLEASEEHCDPWPDEAIAEMWLAAAGGDVLRCLSWLHFGQKIDHAPNIDISGDRGQRIRDHIFILHG